MRTHTTVRHNWTFFRTGGLDQATIESADDLRMLEELDPKLWVALSCPVKGLELDEKTLALIDTDHDGRIGVPEVLAAVKWANAVLVDPAALAKRAEALPLAEITPDTADGQAIRNAARQILNRLAKPDATAISLADIADDAAHLDGTHLVGDGILTLDAAPSEQIKAVLRDIVDCTGGTARTADAIGASAKQVETFFAEVAEYSAWARREADVRDPVFGTATDSAFAALAAVKGKIDDFFTRCRLAAFDPRATVALNRNPEEYEALSAKLLDSASTDIAGFPIARVEAGAALPLNADLNPAWADAVAQFRTRVVQPVLGASKASLTEHEWSDLCARFTAYREWLGQEPALSVKKLGRDRIGELIASNVQGSIGALLAQDQAFEPAFKASADVERLVRYYRDLWTLLRNFVNFADFYSRDRYAAFQAGTLYLDSRSTELCVKVSGPNPLAAMSRAYIAYCTCTPAGGGASMMIAACFTQGDSDYLFVGRNGLFYDRKGALWYAVITSIIDNPISTRQAFWAPYKKLVRFIEEQVAKRAATGEASATDKLANTAASVTTIDQRSKVEPPKKIDVGAVAALGVAITGAISALTLILGYIFGLRWWQYPLVGVGVILAISGPSIIIAWLKLRQRTLGPILEASGWAINGRVKINIPFGAALTEVAVLPPGTKRLLEDPYEDKEAARRRRQVILLGILIILLGAAIWIRWDRLNRGRYFWQPAPPPVEHPASTEPPAKPATATPPGPTK